MSDPFEVVEIELSSEGRQLCLREEVLHQSRFKRSWFPDAKGPSVWLPPYDVLHTPHLDETEEYLELEGKGACHLAGIVQRHGITFSFVCWFKDIICSVSTLVRCISPLLTFSGQS